jgi:hypothetical protein
MLLTMVLISYCRRQYRGYAVLEGIETEDQHISCRKTERTHQKCVLLYIQ